MPGPGHNNHNLWLVLPQSQFGFNFPALLQLCFPAAPSDGRWVMGNACTLEFRSWGLFLPGIFKIWVLFLLHLGWPFMVPEVNVFPDSGRISWDQGVAPSGDLRSKHGPAEPKAEGFFPLFSPSWEEEWRWMDVSPWIWTQREWCIEFWWEFWSLPGDCAPPKCVFTGPPSSKSGVCWGQAATVIQGKHFCIQSLCLAQLCCPKSWDQWGWKRARGLWTACSNLWPPSPSNHFSLCQVGSSSISTWIFSLEDGDNGTQPWNEVVGPEPIPVSAVGTMEISPGSGSFPWITPEAAASSWRMKLNLVPRLWDFAITHLQNSKGRGFLHSFPFQLFLPWCSAPCRGGESGSCL